MGETKTEYGRAASRNVLAETPLLSWLGIEIESVDAGEAVVTLPHRERVTNPDSAIIHGGAVATLIDNAAGTALRTVLTDPAEASYATSDLNVSYLRPATGDMRATATVRRAGSSMAVIQVDVDARTEEGWTTVAIGRVSYFVIEDG